MKKLNSFPISIVAQTSAQYNKAFHSKIFTLFASSESEVFTFAQRLNNTYDFCFAFMKDNQGQWFLDTNGITRLREWVLKGAKKDIKQSQKLYAVWQKDWTQYLRLSRRLLNADLRRLSDE